MRYVVFGTPQESHQGSTLYRGGPTKPNEGGNPSGFSVPAGGKLPSQKKAGRIETADGLWPL